MLYMSDISVVYENVNLFEWIMKPSELGVCRLLMYVSLDIY